MSDINEIVQIFNEEAVSFARHLCEVCPKTYISDNMDLFEDMVNKYPRKMIDNFVLKVLIHKDKIDNFDEEFFMTHSFEDELENVERGFENVFVFKKVWPNLSDEDKAGIFNIMQVLCTLAQDYFVITNLQTP